MKNTLTILALLILNLTFAQNYKFGKVSEDELKEVSNPANLDAHATVLYKMHKVDFTFAAKTGFTQINTYHERIKIYDEEGFNWANKKIKLYDGSGLKKEILSDLNAYTFNLEDGKIKKTKLKSEGVFEEKNNKYWATKSITMPNIKAGCIIELEYSIESPFMSIDDIVLQYDIPIKRLEVDLSIPEYFNYKKILNPKALYSPKFQELTKNRKESINTSSRGERRGLLMTRTNYNTSNLEFLENIFKIHSDNVPALTNEPMVDNRNNYRAKLILEYQFYRAPDGKVENYSTTWNKVTNSIYNNEDFGNQLNKKNYFENEIDDLIANTTEPLDKAMLIYNFVKSKVKWNNYVGYYSDSGVKKAYKEGVGNVADINLMLTSILQYANLPANPILISTKDNGIPIVPSTSGFNYVIAGIEMGDQLILLDASSKYATQNVLPERILNGLGRIIREGGTSDWISLLPKTESKEINSLNFNILEDFSISGKVRVYNSNHLALNYRNSYAKTQNETLIKNLEKGNDITISNLEVTNALEIEKPVQYTYEFNLNSSVEEIGEDLYVSPLLFMEKEENIFKQEERVFPIDFVYPMSEKYVVNIKIPDGYTVASVPENANIVFNNSDAKFSYMANVNGDSIVQLVISLDINNTIVLPSVYNDFKEFYKLVIDKQTDKIVLKKSI